MAKVQLSMNMIPLLVLLLLFSTQARAMRVGGRSQVKNVKDNKEVQDLGRFCVHEYNRRGNGGKLLVFAQVVEAETQVVSGIKYYLKISAATGAARAPTTFEAVVVVKPWLRSKELLHFAPSPTPTNIK